MAQPTPYKRRYNFTDWQTVNPTKPLPAHELEAELNAVELTVGQIRTNLGLIQRDDGKLANQSVTPESLSAGTLALIAQAGYRPRGDWAATTAYAVGDVVDYNLATYLCLVAHTSALAFPTDLGAGRWLLIANGALSGEAQAVDLFEGNGSQTAFTLSVTYQSSNAATVFVGGVAQIPGQDFTISGRTLTFVSAPAAPAVAGRKNIMVRGTAVETQLAGSQAVTAAANAQGFANAASASATAAAGSASAASTSANAAASSATAASNSANAASESATAAQNSANAASTSAGNAANSASAASTSANNASNSASAASASATTATTQANNAANSASAAQTSANNAASSASAALSSANAASASAAAADSAFDAFDDRYLGSKAIDPTVDNDGNALLTGALYWNTTVNEMRVWNGSSWRAVVEVVNAATATKLQTARTLTIGKTGKSFDGSANVAWSLEEIGATNANGDYIIRDARDVNTPTNLSAPGVRYEFKANATDGLNDGGGFHAVMTFQPWHDYSGGNTHQLGFTDNGNLWLRTSPIGGTWGPWQKIYHSGNINTANTPIWLNPRFITADFTVPAAYNGASVGPISISDGVTVTIQDHATWSIH